MDTFPLSSVGQTLLSDTKHGPVQRKREEGGRLARQRRDVLLHNCLLESGRYDCPHPGLVSSLVMRAVQCSRWFYYADNGERTGYKGKKGEKGKKEVHADLFVQPFALHGLSHKEETKTHITHTAVSLCFAILSTALFSLLSFPSIPLHSLLTRLSFLSLPSHPFHPDTSTPLSLSTKPPLS